MQKVKNSGNDGSFEVTIFSSLYDNKTYKRVSKRNWKKFTKFLFQLSHLEYTKQDAPLISPAIYKEGSTRSNKNVVAWAGWCALDIDNHPFKSTQDIVEYMNSNHADKAYVCYSTASSTKEMPKFRLVFPLTRWVRGERNVQRFWFALNQEFAKIADQQTKDASRMYFIPAAYQESSNNFFWAVEDGNPIDPDLLIQKQNAEDFFSETSIGNFLDHLPEKMRHDVVQYREQQLKSDGKYYTWTSYRDCPFVNKQLIDEYKTIVATNAEGRYRGLYKLMVSVAGNAIRKQYPITAEQVKQIVMEIDDDIDGFYSKKKRRVDPEVERAIAFVYSTGGVLT